MVSELNALKDVMVENLDNLIQRQEKIEVIQQKSESLQSYSKTYKERARKVKV